MKIESYEKAFLAVGGALLVACMGALLYATFALDIHLPGAHGTVDPVNVRQTPPFDQPGVREIGPGEYEAVLIGRAWQFEPNEIRVPVGSRVNFTATTIDVIHGLNVEGTRLNMMLIPGQISHNSIRFEQPGEYLIICHEYCGINHHTMFGKVIVE
jgi:cytochrome c oxidase subunit II